MFLEWDQILAFDFPHRFCILPGAPSFKYEEDEKKIKRSKKEMEIRKKWAHDNSSGPIMLANSGRVICFMDASDAMAFRLRWM